MGRKMRLNSVPFPFRAAEKPIAHVAKVANFAAKGHVTIHILALKDDSLSTVRGQNRGGHDIPACRSTLPAARGGGGRRAAAVAEGRPPLSRPPLSSHKAAMLQSLASSRKLDIRGPPPKSC